MDVNTEINGGAEMRGYNKYTQHREVSTLLGLGIFFFPLVFVWFLCGPGYTTAARIVGFIWFIISFIIVSPFYAFLYILLSAMLGV